MYYLRTLLTKVPQMQRIVSGGRHEGALVDQELDVGNRTRRIALVSNVYIDSGSPEAVVTNQREIGSVDDVRKIRNWNVWARKAL